ncbi:MAG: metal ABC transporter permease [Opitutaceae bacterium]|nr:metal ABC transporter permease [Opitutaceae bacterium]
MTEIIPNFDPHAVLIAPWTENLSLFGWIAAMGFAVTGACGLIGNYLMLRRMALMGDAVSHSVLPGLVAAFLISGSRGTLPMFVGALAAGGFTSVMIETIHKLTRVKQDAAIGITFSTLFAIGVVMTSIFAAQVDLDADCVLYGEIAFVPLEPMVSLGGIVLGPVPFVRMASVLLVISLLIIAFYKQLLVSAFDPGLARSLGTNPVVMHYGLMAALSVVVVSAFESVGAILVIAMLILPGATASLISTRLSRVHLLSLLHAAISAWLGVTLGVWLDCSIAAAMVVAGALLFGVVWIVSPREGLIVRWAGRRAPVQIPPQHGSEADQSRQAVSR